VVLVKRGTKMIYKKKNNGLVIKGQEQIINKGKR